METGVSISRKHSPTLLAWTLALAWALGAPSGAGEDSGLPRLTYTKVLKGSVPEYLSITVDTSGVGVYEGRQLNEKPDPRSLKLSAATTQELFERAERLDDFRSIDLESHKKVANLGLKTFTYEKDGVKNSAEFNYTLRRDAQELSDLFEKVATVEEHIQVLEFSIKYDPLGLPGELLQIRMDLDHQALAEPGLMVPALEEIARNPRFLHLAQVRAQDILERVQASN